MYERISEKHENKSKSLKMHETVKQKQVMMTESNFQTKITLGLFHNIQDSLHTNIYMFSLSCICLSAFFYFGTNDITE